MKLLRLFMLPLAIYSFLQGSSKTSFSGITNLSSQEFQELHIDGVATLKKVQARTAQIFGSCTLDFCTFEEGLEVDGSGILRNTSVEGLFVGNGGISIYDGTFDSVSINGGISIKGAVINGDLINNGGSSLNNVQVKGISTIHGNLSAYDSDLQSLIVQGQEVFLKRCKVHGPIMMKKFYAEEKAGWVWLRGIISWVKRLIGWKKKHQLELINTKVYGDIIFEVDEHVEGRVVYLSGSSEITGSIIGARVAKR